MESYPIMAGYRILGELNVLSREITLEFYICITYMKRCLVISAGNIIYNSQMEIFPLERNHAAQRV